MSNSNDIIKKFENNYFECDTLVNKYKYLLENKDILDIGSNVGLFSKSIINTINFKSIHLFEPCKEYYEYSKTTINSLKHNGKIFFNNYGLSDNTSQQILYKSQDNIGWNTFLNKDPNQSYNFTNNMGKELCYLKTLDDYIIDNIDFIKIDVEGYEYKVLKGGFNTIKKFKPYLLIEVGWGTNHPLWKEECLNVYNMLFDIGYQHYNFTDKTEDVLFIPNTN
jgi:FkbM family methyltransferase